jgi:hypothetical protein
MPGAYPPSREHPGRAADGADGVADDAGPHLAQLAAVRHTRRRAVARYGLTATPTGEICPVTRVVTGPPVSGASLIVPLMSLLAQ